MPKPATDPDTLQVGEDRAWQEKFWTAQRVGWLLMALVILAALLGLTGKGGPLASATATSSEASIDYPQITRWQSDEQVTLRLPPATSGQIEVLLSPGFAKVFSVNSMSPEPSSSEARASGHTLIFNIGNDGSEKDIVFNVTSGKPVFSQAASARIGNAQPLRMRVTVLP